MALWEAAYKLKGYAARASCYGLEGLSACRRMIAPTPPPNTAAPVSK